LDSEFIRLDRFGQRVVPEAKIVRSDREVHEINILGKLNVI